LRWSTDVWANREKFVQFEAYAEKLSAEAVELRNKINKEQRESRRLTSLVTMTAQEKLKLQIGEFLLKVAWYVADVQSAELQETESAQRAAAQELEKMKHNMEKMELERSQMVAEVEAQIERALQSMMIGDSDMEWDEEDLEEIPNESPLARVRSPILDSAGEGSDRPMSPRSVISSRHGNRRRIRDAQDSALSDGGKSARSTKSAAAARLRSFGTASTLAEIADKLEQVKNAHGVKSRASSRHGHVATKSRASSHHGHGSDRGGGGKLKPQRSEQKLNGNEADEDSSLSEKERQELEREKAIQRATKRFSTGAAEGAKNGTSGGDGMMSAVDAGIVEKSDRIAEKVKQIQQRVSVIFHLFFNIKETNGTSLHSLNLL
jgi:NTP pyrophosphatase (non-canonical NTP hydrolase)